MALYQKGQTNDAITQLTRALRLKPDFEPARNALNELRKQP
jgi:Tfp pilus assembly protein PilF